MVPALNSNALNEIGLKILNNEVTYLSLSDSNFGVFGGDHDINAWHHGFADTMGLTRWLFLHSFGVNHERSFGIEDGGPSLG